MKPIKLMKEIASDIVSLVYPHICVGCGSVMPFGGGILCAECRADFDEPVLDRCPVCGRIIYHRGKCRSCNGTRLYFDRGHSVFEYKDNVRNAVLNCKYRNMKHIGRYFGEIMADYAEKNALCGFDMVTAVPLHKNRMRQRGYNQSDIPAAMVASRLNTPCVSALERVVDTKPQNFLSREERLKNIKRAFAVRDKEAIKGKSILLIDDIYTTGATVNECAKVLKKNGASRVEFLTFSCRAED